MYSSGMSNESHLTHHFMHRCSASHFLTHLMQKYNLHPEHKTFSSEVVSHFWHIYADFPLSLESCLIRLPINV